VNEPRFAASSPALIVGGSCFRFPCNISTFRSEMAQMRPRRQGFCSCRDHRLAALRPFRAVPRCGPGCVRDRTSKLSPHGRVLAEFAEIRDGAPPHSSFSSASRSSRPKTVPGISLGAPRKTIFRRCRAPRPIQVQPSRKPTRHQYSQCRMLKTQKPCRTAVGLSGPSRWWSRRITREHWLVYRIGGTATARMIEIAQCRYHT